MKNLKEFVRVWSWILLILFCVIGLFYPIIGALALICMIAPIVFSFFKGRYWCGNFCPRGRFSDIILSKISPKRKIPGVFKKRWFRFTFLAVLMSLFTVQIILSWGNMTAIGTVFIRMILITTLLTILLAALFNQRTWCTFCPMGTLAHLVAKYTPLKNNITHVTFNTEKCVNCKICSKNCPIEIDVLEYKGRSKVLHADCLKCELCIRKCPKNSLYIA